MSDLPAPQTWETMFVLRGLKPPSEPSEYLQLDYIQLPLSGGYQYVLTICMFSGWPGDFCCKVDGFVKGSSLTPCWICFFKLCFCSPKGYCSYSGLPQGTLLFCLNVKPTCLCSGTCLPVDGWKQEGKNWHIPSPELVIPGNIFKSKWPFYFTSSPSHSVL